MIRSRAVTWALLGCVASGLGWAAGALVGSNMGRTVLAATFTAIALGLFSRRPRLALFAGLATAAATTLAFLAGQRAVTPLIAWPVAGLAIGLGSVALLHRTRARVTVVVAAPLLGSLGFVLGAVAVVFAAMAANNAVLLGQFLWGGAAGFGLLTLAAVWACGGRLDRAPASTGDAA
jgi:hypothetical protein